MALSITPGPFPPRKFSELMLHLLLTDEEPWCTQGYCVPSFIGPGIHPDYCSMFGDQTCRIHIVFPAPRRNLCTPLGDDCEEVLSERSL